MIIPLVLNVSNATKPLKLQHYYAIKWRRDGKIAFDNVPDEVFDDHGFIEDDYCITHNYPRKETLNMNSNNATVAVGIKFDNGKPDLALLPASAKEGIARAFMDGERKYGRYNYLKGMDWSRLIAAADRHLTAFNNGEDVADDSKLNHLFHAGACIMMLIEYYENKLGNDNRRPKCLESKK